MNKEEIRGLMSDHLRDLKEIANECDEEIIPQITMAMIQSAAFLLNLDDDENEQDC